MTRVYVRCSHCQELFEAPNQFMNGWRPTLHWLPKGSFAKGTQPIPICPGVKLAGVVVWPPSLVAQTSERHLGEPSDDDEVASTIDDDLPVETEQNCQPPADRESTVAPKKRFRKLRSSLGPRKQTLTRKSFTREEMMRAELELASLGPDPNIPRPRVRADCADVPRPCPFVSCRYNLFLDINPETGSITLNFPELEPHEMPAATSCSLDVAERGGLTLEAVGDIMNLTRERIRQVEVRAYLKTLKPEATKLGLHEYAPPDTGQDDLDLFDPSFMPSEVSFTG